MRDAGIMTALTDSAAALLSSRLWPCLTWVNSTGCSPISMLPPIRRATVNREVARSPGSGKSERKCAPREFSRRLAASAITRLISQRERRLSQSCQLRLNARSLAPMAVCEHLGLDRVESCASPIESRRIAHHADIIPHCVQQLFPQGVQVSSASRERVQRA